MASCNSRGIIETPYSAARTAAGYVTIHRIVEQEAPLFLVSDFFPTITKEMLDENRSWMEPKYFIGGKVAGRSSEGIAGESLPPPATRPVASR